MAKGPVIVDTSVWIAFFRSATGTLPDQLIALLDEDRVIMPSPVKIELLCGSSKKDAPRIQRLIQALPEAVPLEAHWQQAEEWALNGALKGHHFAMGDLLIATLSSAENAPLWTLDSDFHRMEKLGYIKLHRH